MAILQTLGKIPERFSDLAGMVYNRMMLQAGEATRVDFVGDQYPESSIKDTHTQRERERERERERREVVVAN